MTISKLYEDALAHHSLRISSWHYKLNKGLVNLFYPLLGSCSYGLDSNSNIIISLASYPDRIETVYLTIMTLLNQTVKPKAVMLWLAKEQFEGGESDLPDKLLALKSKGLTIRFCEDLRPHKKYYYTMKENPDCDVITVDDDVFYPENLLEMLLETAKKYPNTVVCTWGHGMILGQDGDVNTADKWQYLTDGTEPSFSVIPTGVGGVFYPAHCLDDEVFNDDAIRQLCLNADDLWLKAMAVLKRTKAVRVNKPARLFFSIIKTQKSGLYFQNALEDKNSIAWTKIMMAYPECRRILIDSLKNERKTI
ncbi:MAG: hypothetical protein IJ683_04050 [Butyrivibrio sp.]|nr:hypothetical protein [Butyrivibrio sp.]MBR1641479.1 hypothetical protein [Butyrivibrio sp.]